MNGIVPTSWPRTTRLWNANFFLLWQGQLVSHLGTQAAFVATILWTLESTGSPGLMALLLITSWLRTVMLGPVVGAVVDRHSRKAKIIGADVIRGLAALTVGGAMLLRPTSTASIVALLMISAIVGGLANAVFGPAVRAALPDIVPTERLAGNALSTMGLQASSLVGLAAGGTLYAAIGPAMLFVADGLSYLFSAGTETFIRLPSRPRRERGGTLRSVLSRYRVDTMEGLRYCLADPGRRGFMALAAGLNFLFMPIFVLLPLYVERVLGASPSWYGFLLAELSGGSLLGLLCAGRTGRSSRRRFRYAGSHRYNDIDGQRTDHHTRADSYSAQTRGRALAVLIALTSLATSHGLALGEGFGELASGHIAALFGMAGLCAMALSGVLLSRPPVRPFLGTEPAG